MKKNEIEIRIWDKGDNKMKYADIEHFDDMVGFRFEHKSIEADGEPDMIEIMLFSGRLDEDRKKIFDGDICSNEVAKWEIIFHTGCFCGKRIGGSDGTQNTHLALRAIRGLRIIGNIYETPELLKTDI